MKTFLEKYDELSEFRVVSKAQRKKMGMRMKRMAKSSAFKAKKARNKLRIASPEKILMKARKLAKQKFSINSIQIIKKWVYKEELE